MVNQNIPYFYYAPGYDYGQSPYNPYNPYIPGATIGVDGSIVVPQLLYALPSYESSASPVAYVPVVHQSGPDAFGNGIESYVVNPMSVNQVGDLVSRNSFPSNTPFVEESSNRRSSLGKVSDSGKANSGSKQRASSISISSPNQASTQSIRVGGNQGKDGAIGNVPSGVSLVKSSSIRKAGGNQGKDGAIGKVPSGVTQPKSSFLSVNELSNLESSNHSHGAVHERKQKIFDGRVPDDEKSCPDKRKGKSLGTTKKKSSKHLVVKAYTTKAGNPDSEGNITIHIDQYNRVDFPVDYANAMFFVIKSYSEDDVHKSIKYNVWSSTPNGNKKLNAAYEDARRLAGGDPRGCPIFLFFSVNASGQFCGVAEMIGPVNFDQDMDFWQQDKWSGSFPVKWHVIKDLPNTNFRHIILENNENKPVTFSRDTQEISYRKGLEMLKIFKNYASRTSLLDDFMYYENRQRLLQEVRRKKNENPYLVRPLHPTSDENVEEHGSINLSIRNKDQANAGGESSVDSSVSVGQSSMLSKVQKMVDKLSIGDVPIYVKSASPLPVTTASSAIMEGEPAEVFTTGSTPDNFVDEKNSSIVTIGTIPLDLRTHQRN